MASKNAEDLKTGDRVVMVGSFGKAPAEVLEPCYPREGHKKDYSVVLRVRKADGQEQTVLVGRQQPIEVAEDAQTEAD